MVEGREPRTSEHGGRIHEAGQRVDMAGFEDDASNGGPESGAAEKQAAPESPHARAILTVEERIAHIVGLMERFEWVRGKTAGLLAAEWGLSKSTVENYSAEAHRRIVGDKDEAVRDITLGARKLMKRAVAAGECRDFAAVANILADVSGAKAPTKQEVSVGPVNSATAARFVREAFGEKALPRDLDPEDSGVSGDVPEEPSSD